MDNIEENIRIVADAIDHARKHGLLEEVITFALLYMQQNPGASIKDALNSGCDEWDI